MKISIVYYSHTGNTKKVVDKIEKKLSSKGHSVEMISLPVKEAIDKKPELSDVPELPTSDRYFFASHVEAFSLERVMKKYLAEISDIKDKDVICYLSQGLPKKWMGAKGSLKTMKKMLENKGANVLMTQSVSFFAKNDTDSEISKAVEEIVGLF